MSARCSIEPTSGSEPEVGGQQVRITNYLVKMYGNPDKPIQYTCYLTGGTLGSRVLNIQQILDDQNNGRTLTLICGERTP